MDMPSKRIVVLANSIKKGGRCVAGRMLNDDSEVQEWVRPISDADEGTLMPQHMVTDTAKPLNVLDIVDIPLAKHAGDPCHPEDWYVRTATWRHRGSFDAKDVPELEETPDGLWLGDRARTDRVACDFLQRQRPLQSLYLIRPVNFRIRLSREFNRFKGYAQKKTRAVFDYNGVEYNLSLTDPVVTDRHCTVFPGLDAPPLEIVLPCADDCLVCVSLTPSLNDYHYKVVATVLELSP